MTKLQRRQEEQRLSAKHAELLHSNGDRCYSKQYNNEESDYQTWFWIPVSKILEEGIPKYVSKKSQMDFFAVPPTKCIQISIDDSLDRLFSNLFTKRNK